MSKELNLKLNFSVPITESALVNDRFLIKGRAINETTTSNNHKFIAEELRMAAPSLTGVPLLVDHDNRVESIKGRVLKGSYNEVSPGIDFEANVVDKSIREMIKDGRLNSVSVGALVSNIEEGSDGCLIPRGIMFKELSLVAVPADGGATFDIAMKEAYKTVKEAHAEPDADNKGGPSDNDADNDVIKKGMDEERKEHPELSDVMLRKLVDDHLKKDPKYYETYSTENESSQSQSLKGGFNMEEQKIEVTESAKLKEQLESANKMILEFKAKERKALEMKYSHACESKSVKAFDVSKLDDSAVSMLIEQVESIRVSEKSEAKAEEVISGPKIVAESGTLRGGSFTNYW